MEKVQFFRSIYKNINKTRSFSTPKISFQLSIISGVPPPGSGLLRCHRHRIGAIVKLKWLRRITSVDLSKNKIDDECASALRNLMNIKHLHRLDLSRNEIGASAGVSVLESLMWCRELQVHNETHVTLSVLCCH